MLTWEAKKEAIFEMPVRARRRRRERARDILAFERARGERGGRRLGDVNKINDERERLTRVISFICHRVQTGGAAIMRKGPNLLKLARKEQCLALLNNFRAKMKLDGCIYRVFPSGEVQYLHPKDGVYPEKVNKGRVGANQNLRSIGKNTNPAKIKFSGKSTFDIA